MLEFSNHLHKNQEIPKDLLKEKIKMEKCPLQILFFKHHSGLMWCLHAVWMGLVPSRPSLYSLSPPFHPAIFIFSLSCLWIVREPKNPPVGRLCSTLYQFQRLEISKSMSLTGVTFILGGVFDLLITLHSACKFAK